MANPIRAVDEGLEDRVATLGFELVDVQWAGSRARPVVRLRVDRPAGEGSVTVDDCARVSRGLEPWLDEMEEVPERYVLEVSSPGVDRPLVRPRDFERFAGQDVAVRLREPIERHGRRLEAVLLGWVDDGEAGRVRLRMTDGEEVEVSRDSITGANLVYRWS